MPGPTSPTPRRIPVQSRAPRYLTVTDDKTGESFDIGYTDKEPTDAQIAQIIKQERTRTPSAPKAMPTPISTPDPVLQTVGGRDYASLTTGEKARITPPHAVKDAPAPAPSVQNIVDVDPETLTAGALAARTQQIAPRGRVAEALSNAEKARKAMMAGSPNAMAQAAPLPADPYEGDPVHPTAPAQFDDEGHPVTSAGGPIRSGLGADYDDQGNFRPLLSRPEFQNLTGAEKLRALWDFAKARLSDPTPPAEGKPAFTYPGLEVAGKVLASPVNAAQGMTASGIAANQGREVSADDPQTTLGQVPGVLRDVFSDLSTRGRAAGAAVVGDTGAQDVGSVVPELDPSTPAGAVYNFLIRAGADPLNFVGAGAAQEAITAAKTARAAKAATSATSAAPVVQAVREAAAPVVENVVREAAAPVAKATPRIPKPIARELLDDEAHANLEAYFSGNAADRDKVLVDYFGNKKPPKVGTYRGKVPEDVKAAHRAEQARISASVASVDAPTVPPVQTAAPAPQVPLKLSAAARADLDEFNTLRAARGEKPLGKVAWAKLQADRRATALEAERAAAPKPTPVAAPAENPVSPYAMDTEADDIPVPAPAPATNPESKPVQKSIPVQSRRVPVTAAAKNATAGNVARLLRRAGKVTEEAAALPRALQTTADLSATLKQGLVLSVTRPKQAAVSYGKGIRAILSEEAATKIAKELNTHPNRAVWDRHKLFRSESGGSIAQREEAFRSNLAERLPLGVGKVVKASERGFNTTLNTLRTSTFDTTVAAWQKAGMKPTADDLDALARYVNTATGRGHLGHFEKAAENLSAVMYSPRLQKSRLDLLNPVYYAKLSKPARAVAVRDMGALIAANGALIGLAKLGGAEVGLDPTDGTFGKIKVGPKTSRTWVDVGGAGFTPWLKLMAQLSLREKNGKPLDADGIKAVLADAARSKLAPLPKVATDAYLGETIDGKPFDPASAAVSMISPLDLMDIYEAWKVSGGETAAVVAPLAVHGASVTTYEPRESKRRVRVANP